MKIGVFDSGIGGLSVARAIEKALPKLKVVFRHDIAEHFPYAQKTPDEIYGYVTPIIDELVTAGCQLVVIACNTVSTTLIERLRQHYSVPLIAIEPMIKPAAAQTRSKIIAVCATPTTLASDRYHWLKQEYAKGIQVLEPDCADWSALIEHDAMNEQRLRSEIEPALKQGADVIVLGCTHYHWIEDEIQTLAAGHAKVLQPTSAIIQQVKSKMNEIKQ